jgi:P pilus assembly chaperone PapD
MRATPRHLLLLLALAPTPAAAASLTVAPTRIELDAADPVAVVTLQNNDAEPVMVQVQTFAWPHGPDALALEPTRELIAVPPVFEVGGNGRQVIRVALRGQAPGEREQAYRLLITEVPRGPGRATGIRFALRLSLPVFVTPNGAAPRPVWSIRDVARGRELVLRNEGSAHLQVRRIVLRPRDRPGSEVTIETPAYVLAGQEHSWPLPHAAAAAPLDLTAETSIGALPADVAAPHG